MYVSIGIIFILSSWNCWIILIFSCLSILLMFGRCYKFDFFCHFLSFSVYYLYIKIEPNPLTAPKWQTKSAMYVVWLAITWVWKVLWTWFWYHSVAFRMYVLSACVYKRSIPNWPLKFSCEWSYNQFVKFDFCTCSARENNIKWSLWHSLNSCDINTN